jgi:hypothetical protein
VDRLGHQVHSIIQTLFPNNDAVFRDDNAPIHTAGTVQSWFEQHEGELQHLPLPAQSPNLNISETLWSILETRMRNKFPPPIFLKQLEDKWYKILLETVQNLHECIQRTAAAWKAEGSPICVVSVVFPLNFPTPH